MAVQAGGRILGGTLFKSLTWFFKLGLLSIFLTFIIVNSIIIGIQERSFVPVINDLGSRFFATTQVIQEEALIIIENKGIYHPSEHFWGGIFDVLFNYWGLIASLYIVFLWIKLLSKLFGWSFVSNDSQKFTNLILAILLFIALQMFFLLIFSEPINDQSEFDLAMTPIYAFVDLAKASPYIIKPASDVGDILIGSVSNKSEFNDSINNLSEINLSLKNYN